MHEMMYHWLTFDFSKDPPPSSPPIKKVDDAPPPGVVEHPATPEKLQEEPEDVEEMHENEAEPNNETAGM